jgi:transcriptional regulator with XRE-family HTH domain
MPRVKSGPTAPWPSLAQCTPLGTLLVEWMWRQRPPTPVALLANRMGVDRSTLFSWLTTDRQPQPLQLLLLAQVTELPLEDLATAAGVPLERVLKQRAVLFDYVAWEVGRSGAISDDELPQLLSLMQEVRVAAVSGGATRSPAGDGATGDGGSGAAAQETAGGGVRRLVPRS